MKSTIIWIYRMSMNIIYDFLIMLWGIFYKPTRKLYVEQFYSHLIKGKDTGNE